MAINAPIDAASIMHVTGTSQRQRGEAAPWQVQAQRVTTAARSAARSSLRIRAPSRRRAASDRRHSAGRRSPDIGMTCSTTEPTVGWCTHRVVARCRKLPPPVGEKLNACRCHPVTKRPSRAFVATSAKRFPACDKLMQAARRAARNVDGRVIRYAATATGSMKRAVIADREMRMRVAAADLDFGSGAAARDRVGGGRRSDREAPRDRAAGAQGSAQAHARRDGTGRRGDPRARALHARAARHARRVQAQGAVSNAPSYCASSPRVDCSHGPSFCCAWRVTSGDLSWVL